MVAFLPHCFPIGKITIKSEPETENSRVLVLLYFIVAASVAAVDPVFLGHADPDLDTLST